MIQYQTDFRLNEAKGRFMAESVNKRVLWWSVGQALIILVTGLSQVLILQTFFSEKRPSSLDANKPKPEQKI